MVLLLLMPIWVLCSIVTVATTEKDEVPISQIYGNGTTQPPSGVTGVAVEYHRDLKKKILLSLALASALIAGFLLFLGCLWLFRLKRLKNSSANRQQPLDVAKGRSLVPILGKLSSLRMGGKKGNMSVLEYHLLEAATNNFEESNKIGVGGRGRVYKACLGEGFIAAVKKLDGGGIDREFQNEIGLLSKFQHQNIITLLGYCIHEETRFLVYELMQNGSLESQLHGNVKASLQLSL